MRVLIFILLFSHITFYTYSQDTCKGIFEGRVIDYHNNITLANATIEVLGKGIIAKTDATGNFRLENLCPGATDFEISHPDCDTVQLTVDIQELTNMDIRLEHHLEELDEVKVVGATKKKTNSSQELVIQTKTIEQYSSGTLGDALKEISGVSSLNTGANIVKPIIHGLNGSRVLLLNNGVRMQDMEWGDEHAPNIDINAAGSISIIKGAAALQYGGDAIGGVILLEQSRMPKKDSLFGKTLLSGLTNGRGGNINTELIKTYENGWFVKGQASFKRLGDVEAPDYILSNTGIQELGGSFTIGKHDFKKGWEAFYSYYDAEIAILRASHIGNVDDLIRSINSGQPEVIRPFTYDLQNPRQEVTHHLAKLKGYKRFEGFGRWNLQYDFQSNRRFEYDVRRGDNDDRASLDLELTTHSLSTDIKWDANDKYKLTFGLLGRYQDNFANPDTGVRRLIPDYEKYDFGTFLIGEYVINDELLLDGGVRFDYSKIDAQKFYRTSRWEERGYDTEFQELVVEDLGTQLLTNPEFDYQNISSTIGLQYKRSNDNIFRFNYALAQRAPNPSELFSDGLHHSAARIELGDLRIKSETSHKISASKEQNFKHWGFTLEPYANFINDFILLEPTGVEFTIRGAFPVWEYRQTNARLLGVDMMAYVDLHQNWSTNHQFSLVKGTDTENNIALINIPSANFKNKISFTKEEWNNLEISLESQYVFRQNEFPENISVFSPNQQQEVLLDINTPPDAYHLMSLYSEAKFSLSKRVQLTTSLTVNNLFNTNYREYLNRQRFFADDLGRNIILQLKLNY